jgi:hypothetical protein
MKLRDNRSPEAANNPIDPTELRDITSISASAWRS